MLTFSTATLFSLLSVVVFKVFFSNFCHLSAANLFQEALAEGLEYEKKLLGTEQSYWKWLIDTLEYKKAKAVKMVEAAGMTPIVPEGGYFLMADISTFGKSNVLNF